jgi:hypothetical protein
MLAQKLKPGQCVLVSDSRIFQPQSQDAVKLWLDNLYLRAMPNSAGERINLVGWTIPLGQDAVPDVTLWLTNSTLEGDAIKSSCLFVYGMSAYVGGANL